jgi:glycosyltransferase involved in cell wall biosynthesis
LEGVSGGGCLSEFSGLQPYLFSGRLGVQQRVLPSYRAAFFDLLDSYCQGGASVFAGQPLPEENTTPAKGLQRAQLAPARNLNFLRTTSPIYQCWQRGLFEWLQSWQPQVLIVESNPRTPSTRRAVQWMHTRSRPVLGWGLGLPVIGGFLKPWRERTRRSFLRQLDGMIAYSQRAAQDYVSLGFPVERVFIAPNAVAPRPVWALPARSAQFSGKPYVLFVGRMQARKRIDNLLLACASLPEAIQPRLVIVGEGPARNEFEILAQQIYPSAQFTGALYGKDLERLFLEADLFILPGSGGLAVQQAMSYGLPVMVAEGDGTQGDLVRQENGWLLPPGDLESLKNALGNALADPARLRVMGAASYRIVSEEINLEAMASAFASAAASISKQYTRVKS